MQTQQIDGSDSSSCAVLVLSCDRYRDLWVPFFTLLRRYWPDCSMPVYLGTNSETMDLDWVNTLHAGPDKAWSRRLRFFLESIYTDYIVLLLEDFFLDRTISDAQIIQQIKLLHSLKGVTLRLFPNPTADYFRNNLGVLHHRAFYRVSLQAAIWNRRELLNLLVDEEDPWEFERQGSRRSQSIPSGFYCVPSVAIHYQHVVERGEWFRSTARRYAHQHIGCDFRARPVMHFATACKKLPANIARRLLTKLYSLWLCLRYPEKASHGL